MSKSIEHERQCKRCIRRMDIEKEGTGNFSYYNGTLDCPARLELNEMYQDELDTITACGCCSFDDGSKMKNPEDCRLRVGEGSWAECSCHNTPIIYSTCLSKRNHGKCPYGLKGGD